MKSKSILHGSAAAVACLFVTAAWAQDSVPEAIVSGLFATGGNHPNVRASGAKGICVDGTFTPSTEAASLSKAPHFTDPVPVTARFSMGGSNLNISDKTKAATRGIAVRFTHREGDLVLVMISAPVFVARTPQQLLDFLTVRLPGPDGKPDPEKIRAFASANPETTRQAAWLNARPVPASFAGVDYWGVHAYTLTNGRGEAKVAKLKAIADAGQLSLTEDELKVKTDNFYAEELKDRVGKGAATFTLTAILGEAVDPVDDVTAIWPEEDRKAVKLGTIAITAVQPTATCDAATFDPVAGQPEGVAGPADDPMFEIRSPAYAISLSRRTH
jgi:catalase